MTHRSFTGLPIGRRRALCYLVAVLLVCGLLPAVPGLRTGVAEAALPCPCSIWPVSSAPANPANADTAAVEVGVKLRSDLAGSITGLRFYKGAGNTGTHVGNLWSANGTRLATATFVDETATGWQQVSFATPVAITAGTTYVASYYAPVGRYAADNSAFSAAGVDNAPLHALANGTDGANGVYRYGAGGGFPTNTYQSTNYWVDVVFETGASDSTPPALTARTPAPGSSGVPVTSPVVAAFSEPVTGAQVALAGPAGAVAGSTTYDADTRTATFRPTASLATSTSYTVSVSAARDPAGNTMTPDSWTFSTAATAGGCPCSLWPASATPTTASQADDSAVELGTRFTAQANGYVTALRFYKGAANTGTHVGHLWDANGTLLSTATFGAESASGWQQVTLPAPVAVTAGTSYVASYFAPNGGYAVTNAYFTTARSAPPLTAPASSAATPNGVYRYGASGFPGSTFNATSYWVDVVFNTTAADSTAPTVTSRSPAAGATSVSTGTAVTATFSEPVTAGSIAMTLRSSAGTAVAGTTSYDAASQTATLSPSSALAAGTAYTASVSARDTAGNAMPAPVTWSFTTDAVTSPPATTGPILVVRPGAFSRFLPEILKAEGLNAYAEGNLSNLTAAGLAGYDVVLLGETALTDAQVGALTAWVTSGGNLIAMRPDKKLAGLLGLTAVTGTGATLSDAYVLVNTATGPGVGITNQTIQFHGTADRYTTSGATVVATLYSSPTAATTNPAVTTRNVGTSGGQAMAFTYDLARSVVYTRQGNPAWAGLERDGFAPVRSDDMFWGSTPTNGYLNLDKVAIPQADEQQRLLVNLIETSNRDKKALPRFWYFPRMDKAVVVATGDDHANGGTAGRFNQYAANSPAGCSVAQWQCLRFTSYIFPSTGLSNSQADAYDNNGFEIGLHPDNGCTNFTASSLQNVYASQLASWRAKYTSVPSPVTNRLHCLVWSDWASQAKVEAQNGIGLDTNYYYWPGGWIGDRPGFMTGSGLPMRFADTDGTVLDVYQAATQMTDESDQSYPATPNALLDNALGSLGYYGAFTANMHTDKATTYEDDQLIASARARGVSLVSARQMLTWLKGRDASRFTGITRSGDVLSFTVSAASGTEGLSVVLPTTSGAAGLTSISRGGVAVPYSTETIKGLQYATFQASSGTYSATYGGSGASAGASIGAATGTSAALLAAPSSCRAAKAARAAAAPKAGGAAPAAQHDGRGTYLRPGPLTSAASKAGVQVLGAGVATAVDDGVSAALTGVAAATLPDGTATARWRTDEATDSAVDFGTSPAALTETRVDPALVSEHSMTMTALVPGATYYYRVRSTDAAGNASTSPVKRFVQSAAGVADTTAAAFRVGTRDAGGYVSSTADGELQLAGADAQDFDLPTLPRGWATAAEGGGRTVVLGGTMRLDGTRAHGPWTAGARSLSVNATFAGGDQSVGLASPGAGPAAAFLSRGKQLFASIGSGTTARETRLPDQLLGAPHRYTVDTTGATATLSVDGVPVLRGALVARSLRLLVRDRVGDGSTLTLDWARQSGYQPRSVYASRVLDSQQMVTWDRATWRATVPAGTSLEVSVRTGSRLAPDATWSAFRPLSGPGAVIGTTGRYLQYRVTMSTSAQAVTPSLESIGFTHSGTLPQHEQEVG